MPPRYINSNEGDRVEEEERDDEPGSEGEGLMDEGESEEQDGDDGEGSSEDEGDDDEEREREAFSVRDCGPSAAQTRVSEVAVAGGAVETANAPTCPICMEPWTSQGAHRISCIPCGHVYGRSCLESWLTQRGNRTVACPQCGKMFKHKDIINLYAPEVAIPNSELEKEISNLRKKNIAYLKEIGDFQDKKMQAQFDQMHAAVMEHLNAHQDDKLSQFDHLQAAFKENMKAVQDYFISYIAQYQETIQAKFNQLGIPMVPFPTFQPPRFVIPPRKHLLSPQVGISTKRPKTDVSHSV